VAAIFDSRFFQGLIIFLFACVGFCGECYGLALMVAAFSEHGSHIGNEIFFVTGFILLVLSSGAFVIGFRYWKTQGSKTKGENGPDGNSTRIR
jgi:hypothetical protein